MPSVKDRLSSGDGGFRWILVLGAVVSTIIAVWGLLWAGMLESVLGVNVPRRGHALAHLYGAAMLAVGIGYALAAAQPHRSRSLLVPLFVAPVVTAIGVIAGIAQDQVAGGRGAAFVAYNLAYALLYFRLYPKVSPEREAPHSGPPAAPPPPAST